MNRYPEKRLQEAAIAWIAGHWDYSEHFADAEATGARLDSVGLIDGRLILIEVKTTVSATMVEHQQGRAQSIESKVSGALRAIYRREQTGLATAANLVWNRSAPPKLIILAENVSAGGLRALATMLARRSGEWLFDAEVWRWTGESIEIVWAVRITPPHEGAFAEAEIERLIDRAPRAKARTLDELQQLANQNGSGELFAFFVQTARKKGFSLQRGRSSINFRAKLQGQKAPQTVLGIYLDSAPFAALNVGCWREISEDGSQELPGANAPAAGFLNANRLIRTIDEVNEIIEMFAPRLRNFA